LALAASRFQVPMYALCGSEKFLPPDYELEPEAPKDPREILAQPVPNVTVVNYYFDLTPLDYLAGIITEDGIISPAPGP
jgi:translation initiation factor 2B subunit (eIF-2B alpha/beta/delta family)